MNDDAIGDTIADRDFHVHAAAYEAGGWCGGSQWAGIEGGILTHWVQCLVCDHRSHTDGPYTALHRPEFERPDDGLVDRPVARLVEDDRRVDSFQFPSEVDE